VIIPKRFFHLASGFVIPLMPKCGLSSTHAATVRAIKGADRIIDLHKIGRPILSHDNKPALVPIRDAVERFKSAVWQVNRGSQVIAINEILDGLEAGTYFNQHFQSQTNILKGCEGCESVKLYRFPEDFQQMLIDGGLDPLSQHRNKSTDKPELTPEQETRVRALYADDIKLFNSIQKAGQEFSLEST
jgi:hypothetical protein